MNLTEDNRKWIERIFAELDRGNTRPYVDALAEDVRWSTPGHSIWSRTFHGKQAVLHDLLGPVRAQLVERVHLTVLRILADEDRVVVEAKGRAMTKRGKRYDNEYCLIHRIADHKIVEITEYLDTDLASAVLVPPWATAESPA
jgi:ketosteroid isomerase-like protein